MSGGRLGRHACICRQHNRTETTLSYTQKPPVESTCMHLSPAQPKTKGCYIHTMPTVGVKMQASVASTIRTNATTCNIRCTHNTQRTNHREVRSGIGAVPSTRSIYVDPCHLLTARLTGHERPAAESLGAETFQPLRAAVPPDHQEA